MCSRVCWASIKLHKLYIRFSNDSLIILIFINVLLNFNFDTSSSERLHFTSSIEQKHFTTSTELVRVNGITIDKIDIFENLIETN